MFGLREPWHLLVLLIVILLVFGAPRLPMIAKNLGQSMKIFKKEVKELSSDDSDDKSSSGDSTSPEQK